MATSYKTLLAGDSTNVRSKLHEAIPVTGTIISGTYLNQNYKHYAHDMFTSIYDYPYLSSSANHIFDITFGYSANSGYSGSANAENAQKIQIYNQMAQVLSGYTSTGEIKEFSDGLSRTDRPKPDSREMIFFNFARLLAKDEIQKGTFNMALGVDPTASQGNFVSEISSTGSSVVYIKDMSGSNNYRVDSPAGEYNILYLSASSTGLLAQPNATPDPIPCGFIYYQAGIAAISASVLNVEASGGILANQVLNGASAATVLGGLGPNMVGSSQGGVHGIVALMTGSTISGSSFSVLERTQNVTFNNTTELNSTIYFCRANANEFNYSSNPTYLTSSKIRVKETRDDEPISYITSVGLYGSDNSLLAVGKLSEPLKKTPANEFTLRVRLDY